MFKKQHGGSVLYALHVVQLLAEAVYEEEQEGVRAACDRVEEFLSNTGTEIRENIPRAVILSLSSSARKQSIFGWNSKPSGKRPSSWICRIGRCWKGKY